MKTIKSIALFVCGALFLCSCDDEYMIKKKDKELAPDYGCITGTITFYNTESVIGAYVQLISKEKDEVVYSGLINQGGSYTIENIVPDTYKFRVYKSGYIDTVFSSTVLIRPKSEQGNSCANLDWAITKLPPLLRIVDDKGNAIDSLFFSSAQDDNTRLFSIFNDSPKILYWSITKSAQWISSVDPVNGSLRPGDSKPVIVKIDRKKLSAGVNKTVLQIISEEGSKQLTIIAMGYYKSPEVKVFPVTKLEGASAVFQGKVIHKGEPAYKEKGFVYGLSSMPTLENTIVKLAVSEAPDSLFEATAMELQGRQKYYVRSYAIGQLDTVYSMSEEAFYAQKACTEIYTEEPTDKDYIQGTVTVKARITQEGYPRYTKRGFVYDEVKNPILGDAVDIPVEGYGTGFYSARLRGLEIGKKYYVKAYVVQEEEVVYGSEVEVDFTPVLPEMETTVRDTLDERTTFFVQISSSGNPVYTEVGFLYGLLPHPTLDNGTAERVPGVEVGEGVYMAEMRNLQEGKTYYVCAYARSGDYYKAYGNIVQIKVKNLHYMSLPEMGIMVQREDIGSDVFSEVQRICEGSNVGGFTDWRLPTFEELQYIGKKKNEIGGFPDTYYNEKDYWSSTSCYEEDDGYDDDMYKILKISRYCIESCAYDDESDECSIRAVRTITEE